MYIKDFINLKKKIYLFHSILRYCVYSNSPFYDLEESIRNQGVSDTLYYDPLLKNMRIDTAKGFFSKIEFDSWTIKHFDLNDTVKDSTYYKEFFANADDAEKETLKNEVVVVS